MFAISDIDVKIDLCNNKKTTTKEHKIKMDFTKFK